MESIYRPIILFLTEHKLYINQQNLISKHEKLFQVTTGLAHSTPIKARAVLP